MARNSKSSRDWSGEGCSTTQRWIWSLRKLVLTSVGTGGGRKVQGVLPVDRCPWFMRKKLELNPKSPLSDYLELCGGEDLES